MRVRFLRQSQGLFRFFFHVCINDIISFGQIHAEDCANLGLAFNFDVAVTLFDNAINGS